MCLLVKFKLALSNMSLSSMATTLIHASLSLSINIIFKSPDVTNQFNIFYVDHSIGCCVPR